MRATRTQVVLTVTIICTILMMGTVLNRWNAATSFDFPPASAWITVGGNSTELPEPPEDARTMLQLIYRYVEYPEASCHKLNMFGGILHANIAIDGDKFICLDEGLAPPPGSCLVYSIGINNEWSFDKALTKYGCEVFAFDPSMKNYKRNVTEFGAHFYQIGLGGKTEYDKRRGWKIMTLGDIRSMLGHTGRTIHYLKADIEGSEWDWLQQDQSALDNVVQVGLEIHMDTKHFNDTKKMKRYYETFRKLQQKGFRTIHTNPNRVRGRTLNFDGVPGKVTNLYELVWMKNT